MPLGEALRRLAAIAGVRFIYSPDLLPLARGTCVPGGTTTVGGALAAMLAGTGISAVPGGRDQIILSPARVQAGIDAPFARTVGRLERVVVTGTATGGSERASPVAITVLDPRAVARDRPQSLAGLLDGAVPGVWAWTQAPTRSLVRYGSVRGASSFGFTTPKVYIDGIEVANPLLLANVEPGRIERVEVIRGPQGAALYGADAISGVVNIVTRHEGTGPGLPAAEFYASAGTMASAFTPTGGPTLTQDHALTLRTGTGAGTGTAGGSVSTVGAYVPGASARRGSAYGSARHISPRTAVTATARVQDARTYAPVSPLLAGTPGFEYIGAAAQEARQYTIGASATYSATGRWTHLAVVGVDGARLVGRVQEGPPIPLPKDLASQAGSSSADRGSVRVSSTGRFGAPIGASASTGRNLTVTVGAEHSTARERATADEARLGPRPGQPAVATAWWSNTGVLAQGQFASHNRVFLSGGLRAEHLRAPASGGRVVLLPMMGAAGAREFGSLTAKARAAYGRGIRPARSLALGATWARGEAEDHDRGLGPEVQSGVEGGVDLLWNAKGRARLDLHVTTFAQRATGLIQPVAVLAADTSGVPLNAASAVAYQLQNVGAIDNRGWELEMAAAAGPLALRTTASFVGSNVRRLATGYRGDLRVGDRMLEVPARMVGTSAIWTAPRWSATANVTRAADWINYDRLALARAYAARRAGWPDAPGPVGAQLRPYWRAYVGVTRVSAQATYTVARRTALTLSGENLLGHQTGEPDNLTVLPGRTIAVGARVRR